MEPRRGPAAHGPHRDFAERIAVHEADLALKPETVTLEEVHAYDVTDALTYVRDGKALPHYES